MEIGLKEWCPRPHPVSCVQPLLGESDPWSQINWIPLLENGHIFLEWPFPAKYFQNIWKDWEQSLCFPTEEANAGLLTNICTRIRIQSETHFYREALPGSEDVARPGVLIHFQLLSSTKGNQILVNDKLVRSQQFYKHRNFRLMAKNDCREYVVTKHSARVYQGWRIHSGMQCSCVIICTSFRCY